MLKYSLLFVIGAIVLISFIVFSVSCSSNKMVVKKTGAQLWGENCVRCHNAPSPSAFSDIQWETVTMHMRVRANLTTEETEKIVDFLKMAN